ncbi:MAG TPA: SDR family NAD(P)-dependent oxidoreductase, partial [Dehalococcoidia bacterium]|nr:SDR family NAD(P)-dependent oxidoreductase [Dehalococcoidia bacterium]
MDLGLTGKVALVGGASKGIGRAVALGLASEGCRVAIAARRPGDLEVAAQEIRRQTGAEVLPVACDMARYDDIKRLVRDSVDRFGRLDIVVNNAGGPPTGTFEELTEEQWRKALD